MVFKRNLLPICVIVLLALPTVVQAQFTYNTNNGAITIIGYTGASAVVTVPGVINGLPVTCIGTNAFASDNMTSVTIPDSVTNLETVAFLNCSNLVNINIGDSVTSIGLGAFNNCASLINIKVPNSVTNIGDYAFYGCLGLTNVILPNKITNLGLSIFQNCPALVSITIPASVTNIVGYTFYDCSNLKRIYFQGNAPSIGYLANVFEHIDAAATVYYYSRTIGWGSTYGGLPTMMLNASPQITSVGISSNQFSFSINGTDQQIVVVQACTNLANGNWQSLQTDTLSGTTFSYNDPEWTNYPSRFYRAQ